VGLAETFERATEALPFEEEFRDVEIVIRRAIRHGRTTALTLIVDRSGGVDLQVCERLAKRINAALEAETDPYTLEVESAGLERPLVRPEDFERFRDRAVRVVTTLPIDGAKTHRGTLRGLRANALVLEGAAGELPIPLEMVKTANLEYDPRADLTRDKQERKARKWL